MHLLPGGKSLFLFVPYLGQPLSFSVIVRYPLAGSLLQRHYSSQLSLAYYSILNFQSPKL